MMHAQAWFIAVAAGLRINTGPDLPHGVAARVRSRLAALGDDSSNNLTLNLGRTAGCAPESNLGLGLDGFIVTRTGEHVCAVGNSSLGSAYAAYRTCELLGFAFLHPLAAVAPSQLAVENLPDGMREVHPSSPLKFRGFHIHTEHPLELVEVLQGADALLPNGSTVAWEAMLGDVAALFEWLVANRQNRVQWILLAAPEWKHSGWVSSVGRQRRLRTLTDLGRSFGLAVGADLPIAEIQQRAWYMVDRYTPHDVPAMIAQIRARLDWVLGGGSDGGAGFDYIATESGTSEFTHPDCATMLDLIDATGDYAKQAHGKAAFIKAHASTGQHCPTIADPRDGSPINFNFLPMLANGSMGVLPHTVQDYALDEPTDGAYGNDDFSALRRWMAWEVANDTTHRQVVFHPETNCAPSFAMPATLSLCLAPAPHHIFESDHNHHHHHHPAFHSLRVRARVRQTG